MAMREFIGRVKLVDMEGKPFFIYERRLNMKTPKDFAQRPALVMQSEPWFIGIPPRVNKQMTGIIMQWYEPIDMLDVSDEMLELPT